VTEATPLDRAIARMDADPQDDAARRAFYGLLAAAELHLPVRDETAAEPAPEILELAEGRFVPAFDGEDRLAAFSGRPTAQAVITGAALARALSGRGIGIALNPGVAPGAFVMPPDAVDWLAAVLETAPPAEPARIAAVLPGAGAGPDLAGALAVRFASLPPQLAAAVLIRATLTDGRQAPVLVFAGAAPAARPALARAAAEAAVFAGSDSGAGAGLAVAFPAPGDDLARQALRHGWLLNPPLPDPDAAPPAAPPAGPGTDPARPPRLR